MKYKLLTITICAIACATVQAERDKYDKIVTLDGTEYLSVTVMKVESDGLKLMHSTGIVKVDFIDLPEELREKYGYDPEKFPPTVYLDLKTIDSRKTESLPGQKLFQMTQDKPKAKIYILKGTSNLNENVTDYFLWFFDSEKKILGFKQRTKINTVEDSYVWRLWHDVTTEDFKEGLPYGNDKIRTTPSPYKNPKGAFPLKYEETHKMSTWP